jgi:hypothetical protein
VASSKSLVRSRNCLANGSESLFLVLSYLYCSSGTAQLSSIGIVLTKSSSVISSGRVDGFLVFVAVMADATDVFVANWTIAGGDGAGAAAGVAGVLALLWGVIVLVSLPVVGVGVLGLVALTALVVVAPRVWRVVAVVAVVAGRLAVVVAVEALATAAVGVVTAAGFAALVFGEPKPGRDVEGWV